MRNEPVKVSLGSILRLPPRVPYFSHASQRHHLPRPAVGYLGLLESHAMHMATCRNCNQISSRYSLTPPHFFSHDAKYTWRCLGFISEPTRPGRAHRSINGGRPTAAEPAKHGHCHGKPRVHDRTGLMSQPLHIWGEEKQVSRTALVLHHWRQNGPAWEILSFGNSCLTCDPGGHRGPHQGKSQQPWTQLLVCRVLGSPSCGRALPEWDL